MFTHQVVALCCVKWRHDRHFENMTSNQKQNPTPSINAYIYLKSIPGKFRPDPIWENVALGFFKRWPQQEQEQAVQEPVAVLRWSRGSQIIGFALPFLVWCIQNCQLNNITLLCRSKRLRIRNLLACTVTRDAWWYFHVWKFHILIGRPGRY